MISPQAFEEKPENLEEFTELLMKKYAFDLNKSLKKMPQPKHQCSLCTEDIECGVQLIRRCYSMSFSDRCGSEHECSCPYTKKLEDELHSCCFKCMSKLLWMNSQSTKMLGIFRAKCPYCNAQFCHLDMSFFSFKHARNQKKFNSEKERFTHILQKFQDDEYMTEMNFDKTLNSFQRRVVHEVAQSLGLEHFSTGVGKNRYLVARKKKD